ncbi:storkhead-box protein 1 [Sorex araneus]|uniref:storkhead-box protein 1 n=1 Tax=Sorex araneus TaxID=42254 RepID=UPI002433B121|nr:storkhead-box protein 1 [Sorex araneus]
MARPVQLAPASLALVLCRVEARAAAGAAEEPGGRAVFRAFRRANARCFWNSRLARAASRLAFQGWLGRGVLLVHAPPASLQVLRDAWGRRALRPPRGFRIRALGDVFPVQMNPIAQSQFIPLAEVLCCAISDMNSAQIMVTQESLLEHLKIHYPGIAVPPQDILYTTLGSLIKERKIYHTGEGYFIVTPQTYFITNTTTQENKRGLSDDSHPLPTSITYLVSMGSCAELAKENTSPLSHCQSCRCFPDACAQDVHELLATTEVTGKGQKCLGESKALVRNQAVSVSEEIHVHENTKPVSYAKDREKGKKFGFGLFWRSISRKEKSRTEHTSFSAQFPPEEWPVRDEDNLDNIPRDIEHEIIKRINPILTVDNLIKHTALMQKYEQKKYNSQGTSTDLPIVRHKNSHKEVLKKRQGWSAKPRRQGHLRRDRHKSRGQGSDPNPERIRLQKQPKRLAPQPTSQIKSADEAVEKSVGENMPILGSHVIYKKQINNPFPGLSHRGGPITKGHSVQKTSDLKPSQFGTKGRSVRRSVSLASSNVLTGDIKKQYAEQCNDKMNAEAIYMTNLTVQPTTDELKDHLLSYPQRSALQNGSMCLLRHDAYDERNKALPEVLGKCYSHFDTLGEVEEAQHDLPSPGSSFERKSSVCRFVDKTMYQFQNLALLDYSVGVNHVKPPETQYRDSGELIKKTFIQDTETANLENEGLSDDAQIFYRNGEEEDGACSSLYLDEDDFSEDDDLCQMLSGNLWYSFTGESKENQLGKLKMTERPLTEYNNNTHSFDPQIFNGSKYYKPIQLLTNPAENQKPSHSAESHGLTLGTPSSFNYEEEPSVAKIARALVPTDGNILDCYSKRKTSSEDEALQDTLGDVASWSPSLHNQDMKKQSTQKLELFSTSHMPVLAQNIQREHSHLEGTESHSMAGDSGIDSPRTQSLASNNSVILDGLKRRQNFLQKFEGAKTSQTLSPNSLLQLTPAINV